MQIKNTFIRAKMNKDVDERLVPNGEYLHAENISVSNSEGSEVGALENVLGNEQLTDIDLGSNPVCIGSYSDEFEDKIYWFIKSDLASAIYEWDNRTQTAVEVLYDSRVSGENVLNFNEDYLITGVNLLIDSDNNSRILLWTDDLNPLRSINVERSKTFGVNSFTSEAISVVKRPPLNKPSIELFNDENQEENNFEESFTFFAYRYRYEDNEISALSPFSDLAFEPEEFSYDFSTSTNESMVNKFNSIRLTFNTGNDLVKGVDIVYKESRSNSIYEIESFTKELEQWSDNDNVTISISTRKIDSVLPENENDRLYDNVPRKAKSQELIGNRLVYGNYLENYNLIDTNNQKINLDLKVDVISTPITDNIPKKSLKSNREYEIGISYLDEDRRMTTVLTSANNDTIIDSVNAINQNKLQVTINNLPPSFATHYRFFIKQPRLDYDTISPTIFYQDGVFVWVLLEGDEVNKISAGDFLYVKSDTSGILEEAVQTEVLEIRSQPQNFLESEDEEEVRQQAGTYFKLKPSNFEINQNNASLFTADAYGFKSRNTSNNLTNNISYIENPVYYGTDGLDDLSQSGTYTGTTDIRYIVEILTVGGTDTFRWSDDNGATFSSGVSITGSPQLLNNGLSITFSNTTGHDEEDRWIISAKSSQVVESGNNSRNAWIPLLGKRADLNETIRAGAQITIRYNETRDTVEIEDYTTTLISSRDYANIEEWFYEDNVVSQLEYPDSLDKVVFRRGTSSTNPVENISIDPTRNMYMIFRSRSAYSGGERIRVPASIEIVEFENNIILETKPQETNSSIFFEIGDTYSIVNNFHTGLLGDTNQTASTPAIITLNIFNCFSWGNGYESYKIRDKFNESNFVIDTRPLSTVPDYRENRRIASLTYSNVYEQTTNFNGLNEFNLSTSNFKDMDDRYGSIQKLFSRDTNLIVFQEDKVHRVLYQKDILFDADGSGNVRESNNVLSNTEVPYAGEYGIGFNPESFAFFGNRIWFTDPKRGVVLRLSVDGLTEISEYGMRDFFRDDFITRDNSIKLGGYDPYFDQYILSVKDNDQVIINNFECGTRIFRLNQVSTYTYTLELTSLIETINLGYNLDSGTINISVDYNGVITSTGTVNASGTLNVPKTNVNINTATVTVSVISGQATYRLTNRCTEGITTTVKSIVTNDIIDVGNQAGEVRYQVNSGTLITENPTFNLSNVSLFKTRVGFEGTDEFPDNGDNITLSIFYSDDNENNFFESFGNRLGYLVSNVEYGQSDLSTIKSLATYPTITTQSALGGITYSITFNFNKVNDEDILYLLWDYEDTIVIASDDTATVFQGQSIDINVLNNDQFSGDSAALIITSLPVNGSLTILSNSSIRYTHNDSSTTSDSFVYRMDNGLATDTATVNITITPDTGGGTGSSGQGFLTSSVGNVNSETSCGFSLNTTRFHDGSSLQPSLDDIIYTDVNKTTVFNGNNLYYVIEGGKSIQIDIEGRVLDLHICGQGNA